MQYVTVTANHARWAFGMPDPGQTFDAIDALCRDHDSGAITEAEFLSRMAAIDHPLARCVVLFFHWRGRSLERFGVTYVAGPPPTTVRSLALRVLTDDPAIGGTLDIDDPVPKLVGHENIWFALYALHLDVDPADRPLAESFADHPDAEVRQMAAAVLRNLQHSS